MADSYLCAGVGKDNHCGDASRNSADGECLECSQSLSNGISALENNLLEPVEDSVGDGRLEAQYNVGSPAAVETEEAALRHNVSH